MPKEKKRVTDVRRAIVTPDKHAPLHDKPAINVLLRAIDIVKPDIYIDLGDVGEWHSISPWRYKRRKRPPLDFVLPELDADIAATNALMDQIDDALDVVGCQEKHFCIGNHEAWLEMFVEEFPYLDKYLPQTCLRLSERGYKWYPCGEKFRIGKLYFYHGHHHRGVHHDTQHLRNLGCNIMYGHWHDIKTDRVTNMDGPRGSWSTGCLKKDTPVANDWLQNRQVNWSHGFAIVTFFRGGNFVVNQIEIIRGRADVWGNVINGN
jgi:hypothetical protein